MKAKWRHLDSISLLALLLAASCRSTQVQLTMPGRVEHVVVCWLKSPGEESARRRIIDESKAFVGVIPGLVRVSAGTSLPSTRPTVDTSFDVAIVMTFQNQTALRAYEQHPRHKHAVENVLRPHVAKLVIYDFEVK